MEDGSRSREAPVAATNRRTRGGAMSMSRKPTLRVWLCCLVAASVGVVGHAGAANAATGGAVIAWGCSNGGNNAQCDVPAAAAAGVIAISAGGAHSLALKRDGGVIAWGCRDGLANINDHGQCIVPPAAMTGVTAIAAGGAHSLALKQDGSVVAWGCQGFFGDWGQCTVPASAASGVTAIAAGSGSSLA